MNWSGLLLWIAKKTRELRTYRQVLPLLQNAILLESPCSSLPSDCERPASDFREDTTWAGEGTVQLLLSSSTTLLVPNRL
jgi:hypothetical protein